MTQPPLAEDNKDAFRNNRPSSSFVYSPHRETFVRNDFHFLQSARGLCATLANERPNSVSCLATAPLQHRNAYP